MEELAKTRLKLLELSWKASDLAKSMKEQGEANSGLLWHEMKAHGKDLEEIAKSCGKWADMIDEEIAKAENVCE